MSAHLLRGGVSAAAIISASVMFAGSAGAAPVVDLGLALSVSDRPAAFSPAASLKSIKAFKPTTLAVIADISADAGPAERDPLSRETQFDAGAFKSDPIYQQGYDPDAQIEIYGGKRAVKRVLPLIEIGRDLYGYGEIGEGINLIGDKNRLTPQLLVFGDARTAVAYNKNAGGKEVGQIATRLNFFANLQLTGSERILMLWEPLQDDAQFSRYEFTGPDRNRNSDPQIESQGQPTTLFFAGISARSPPGFPMSTTLATYQSRSAGCRFFFRTAYGWMTRSSARPSPCRRRIAPR